MDQPLELPNSKSGNSRFLTPSRVFPERVTEEIPIQGPAFPPLEIQPMLRSDERWITRVMGYVIYTVFSGRNGNPSERISHQTVYASNGHVRQEDAIEESLEWIRRVWLVENEDRGYILLGAVKLVRNKTQQRKHRGLKTKEDKKAPYTIPELKNPIAKERRTNGYNDY